jgi:hypothetical protein
MSPLFSPVGRGNVEMKSSRVPSATYEGMATDLGEVPTNRPR